MKAIDIPAIRGYMGSMIYYTATFTFKQIAERVNQIDDKIYKCASLSASIMQSLVACQYM